MKPETRGGGGVACQDPPGPLLGLIAPAEHAAEGAHERTALYPHLAASSNGRVGLLPPLFWRSGLGRGSPLFNDSQERMVASVAAGADWFIPKECLGDELSGAIAPLFSGCDGGTEGERL